ncbi:hypothetical protein F5B19DRAFT_479918 [Rostrohypoxylon terebratum]|nr:hypothetical protein F5B19DRAFT_479918 [Rostrohypoxylon terebratum]
MQAQRAWLKPRFSLVLSALSENPIVSAQRPRHTYQLSRDIFLACMRYKTRANYMRIRTLDPYSPVCSSEDCSVRN